MRRLLFSLVLLALLSGFLIKITTPICAVYGDAGNAVTKHVDENAEIYAIDTFDYDSFLESYDNLADTLDFTICLTESYTMQDNIDILNSSMHEETPSGYMVNYLSNNTLFNTAYSAWLLSTYAANPSEFLADEFSRVSYYEIIILKLIEAEFSQDTAIDWITQKGVRNSISISKSFTSYAKQNNYQYILNNNDFSDLTEEQMQTINQMAKNYMESQVQFKYVEKDLNFISSLLSYASDIESLTEKMASYVQLGQTMDATIAFLTKMRMLCDNIYLTRALDRVILLYQDSFKGFVLKLIEEGALLIGKNYVVSMLGKEWKNYLIGKLTGGVLSNGSVIVNGITIGAKLGQTISNIVFSTDEKLDKYEMMRCLTIVESVAELAVVSCFNEYDGSINSASNISAGVDFLYSTYALDAQFYIEMAEIAHSDWLGGITDAELEELTAVGETKITEYKEEYEALSSYTGTCGTSAKWVLLNNGSLVIFGSGSIDNYSIGKAPWYALREKINRIYVSSSITMIGRYAFYQIDIQQFPIVLSSSVTLNQNAFKSMNSDARVIALKNVVTEKSYVYDHILYAKGSLTVTGDATISSMVTIGSGILRDTGILSALNGTITVTSGASLTVLKNLTLTRSIWSDNRSGIVVSSGGYLKVFGDVNSAGGLDDRVQTDFKIYGKASVDGNLTTGGRIGFTLAGELEVAGNLTLETSPSGKGTVILSGNSGQTISGTYYNLVVQNTSSDGITANGKVYVKNNFDNQATNLSGHFELSGGFLRGPVFNGSIIVGSAVLKESVKINGSMTSTWGANVEIPSGVDVVVSGGLSFRRFYLSDESVINLREGASLTVNGAVSLTGWAGTGDRAEMNVYGCLKVGGNISVQSYGYITTYKNGQVQFFGSNNQSVTGVSSFRTICIDKPSGTVSFQNKITVSVLFNHQGNSFALYNNGSGSSFVDYDGDGMKDNVDPEPTVGNPCTITVQSENTEHGTVSENLIETFGGATVTLKATPSFKYKFVKWINSVGKTVSTSPEYSFIVKSSDSLTAVFVKRTRPILVQTENGTITAPSTATIESTVNVSVTESEGYIFEQGSLCYNGISITDGCFVMPDEDVVLTAVFTRNEHYFALKEKIEEAQQYQAELYTIESYEALQNVIAVAEAVLENHITEDRSIEQISALDTAVAALMDRFVVQLEVLNAPTLYIGVESMIRELSVQALYDNGTTELVTDFSLSGFDCNILGEQTITVLYGAVSVNTTVIVEKRPVDALVISDIPDQVYQGNGTSSIPGITAVFSLLNETLVENVDYALSYANNDAVGTATITITGIGNYTGETMVSFTINCVHNYENTLSVLPTCTTDGKEEYTCSICFDHYTNIHSAIGHNYESTVTLEASCEESGILTYTCIACGDNYTEDIPAVGHSYTDGICSSCGNELPIYTVSFSTPEGITAPEALSVWEGENCVLPDIEVPESVVFAGWSTENIELTNKQPVLYKPGATYKPQASEVLYAIFFHVDRTNASGTGNYIKLTEEPGDWNGSYLLVCESTGYIFDASDVSQRYGLGVEVEIHNSNDGTSQYIRCQEGDLFSFEISLCEGTTDQFLLRGSSGYYIYKKSMSGTTYDKTELYEEASAYPLSIGMDGIFTYSGNRVLRCFTSKNTFRFYSTTLTGEQYAEVSLYKKTGEFGEKYYSTEFCLCSTGVHVYSYNDTGSGHNVECVCCSYSNSESHTYIDGICICGACEPREIYIAMGHAVSFDSDMKMNYRIKIDSIASIVPNYVTEGAYLVVEKDRYPMGGGTKTVETVTLYPDLTTDSTRMLFSLGGIQSVEMGSELRAVLHFFDENGNEYYTQVDAFSVLTYAEMCLNFYSPETDGYLFTMLIDCLNYGSAAQVTFDRRADELVNAGLDAYQQYATTELSAELTDVRTYVDNDRSITAVTKMGFTVTFADQTEINAKLTIADGYTKDDIASVKVLNENGEEVAVLTRFTELDDGRLQVTFTGVKSVNMRDMYYFVAYVGEEAASQNVGYSIEAYAKSNIASTDVSAANLAKACIYYGDSAKIYFDSLTK